MQKFVCYNPIKRILQEAVMLCIAKKLRDLSFSALMEVYMESNREKAELEFSDLSIEQGIYQAEQDFYQYLREVFFRTPGSVYCLWQENGRYLSALRLEPYKDGLLLEALETAPEYRRKGYAEALLREALSGNGKIYSHVHKNNVPSLRIHEKLGFRRISETAAYIDGSVNDHCCTLCYDPGQAGK
jgi:GNAT superfamily N-acetyltransferase